jgi:hypothetical protein
MNDVMPDYENYWQISQYLFSTGILLVDKTADVKKRLK